MIAKKAITSFILALLLVANGFNVQATKNYDKKRVSAFEKVKGFVLSPKTAVAVPVAAFVAYSVVQGDIPFVDIPAEWLAYFDMTGWFEYFASQEAIVSATSSTTSSVCTTPSVTPSVTISSTITSLVTSTAAHIKSILESTPVLELKEIIQDVPQSVLNKIPGAPEIAQKIMNDVQSVSESEISALIESVQAFSASVKAGTQTLGFWDNAILLSLAIRHREFLNQFEGLVG